MRNDVAHFIRATFPCSTGTDLHVSNGDETLCRLHFRVFLRMANLLWVELETCKMKCSWSIFLLLALLQQTFLCRADITMSSIFSNGAILQTTDDDGHAPVIFGTANSEATMIITVSGGKGNVFKQTFHADGQGQWNWYVSLPNTSSAKPGPYSIGIEEYTANGTIYIDSAGFGDVYFGDVYFCSGQSNMVYNVKGTTNAAEELARANYTNVRLFKAPGTRVSLLDNADTAGSSPWMPCNNETVASFSAVCYLAAENIMKMHTKDRYIGLIESAVGGTGVQLWATNKTDHTCGQSSSQLSSNYKPASLYETMILPYLPYTVRAAIWYQGEANADECCPIGRSDYTCYLEHMMRDWRAVWGYDVPFVVIQLHTWGYLPCDAETPVISQPQAGIRLAEWDVWRQNSNDTFLVTAADQGGSLHPPYKSEVARRVALALIANVFKQNVTWLGPSIVNGTANHTTSTNGKRQFEVDLILKNGEGLKLVKTRACNGTKPDTCTRYCCNNGAPGLFILEGYDWSSTYSAHMYNLAVTSVADNRLHLSMLTNDTYDGKAHLARLLYAVGSQPTCSVVNGDGIAMATQGPIYRALR